MSENLTFFFWTTKEVLELLEKNEVGADFRDEFRKNNINGSDFVNLDTENKLNLVLRDSATKPNPIVLNKLMRMVSEFRVTSLGAK